MEQLAKKYRISSDAQWCEVHFEIGGFWDREAMDEFLDELTQEAMTFITQRKPFSALGDMEHFVPQSRETAEAIRANLVRARQGGLERVAILRPPVLVKMQYERIAQGIEVRFFDDKGAAKSWLRETKAAAA